MTQGDRWSGATPTDPGGGPDGEAATAVRALVLAALDAVIDPCSVAAGEPAGLVTMGLVSSLHVDRIGDGWCAHLQLGLTEPACVMGHAFVPRARAALGAVPGIVTTSVTLDHAFTWSEEQMDPAYLARRRAKQEAALHPARLVPVVPVVPLGLPSRSAPR